MKHFAIMIAVAALTLVACTHEETDSNVIVNAIQDVDGNQYDAVRIGEQLWLKQDLRTTHFRDGSEIERYDYSYYNDTIPKYERVGNHDFGTNYSLPSSIGLRYNWYAVSSPRGLCPQGWHVPSKAEWEQLLNYVNGHSEWCYNGKYGAIAKALASQQGWRPSILEGTPGCHQAENNATGFDILPYFGGAYGNQYFLTSTLTDTSYSAGNSIYTSIYNEKYSVVYGISSDQEIVLRNNYRIFQERVGVDFYECYSDPCWGRVRCIKD